MVFYAGIILIGVALFMTFILIRNSKRPKLKVRVEEITLQYHKKDKQQIKKHKHARVSYLHEGKTSEDTILLKRKSVREGETIVVSYKDSDISKMEHYEPRAEIIAIIAVFTIGISILGFCFFVMDYFNLWEN